MKTDIRHIEVVAPNTLAEALKLLKDQPNTWRPIAGGTDLMVLVATGNLKDRKILSLSKIKELKGINANETSLRIGAMTTFSELREHKIIEAEFPCLKEAAASVGAIAIQNRGTVGGNIANSSPAADSSPALIAYDAEIELTSASGKRVIPYSDFHIGYKKTELRPDELITAFIVKRSKTEKLHYYRKIGTRKAQAISKICFCGVLELSDSKTIDHIRIAVGSVGPTVLRCKKTEQALKGVHTTKANSIGKCVFAAEIAPIDDIRSTGEYRREVACNILEDFLGKAR